eukprot:superscaffoldBa00000024_g464
MWSRGDIAQKPPEACCLCPACHTGYILPSDLHPCCESCLGAEHAGLALTSWAACQFCARLCSCADTLMALLVEGDSDGSWTNREPPSPMGALELDDDRLGAAALSFLTTTFQLPATKALFQDLLGIIKMVADLRGIPMPADPPAPTRGLLGGDVYIQELLCSIQEKKLVVILTAPERTSASWFWTMVQLLLGQPWQLLWSRDTLLQQSYTSQ